MGGNETMNQIEYKKVLTGLLFLITACVFLIMGFFKWFFFIPAILLVICYFVYDSRYLRCPRCGTFTNLDRLLYAKTHVYHCHGCGEIIRIK